MIPKNPASFGDGAERPRCMKPRDEDGATRRAFLGSALAGSAGLFSMGAGLAQAAENETAPAGGRPASEKHEGPPPRLPVRRGKKRALFVYGGWPGHEPEKCRDLFVPWLRKQGFVVTVSDTLDAYTDEKLMHSLDLIVQIWTMGTIKGPQLRGLTRAVYAGAGLAGWHGGLGDAFRLEVDYQYMVGGQWVAHPGGIIDYRVNITDHEDPITSGLSDFDLRTEQYYMHVDPNNKVLATTRFGDAHNFWIKDAVMPVAWKRQYGYGRVFYTSMGHTADVFDTPQALTIAQRGMLLASDSRRSDTPNLITPVYPSR
jgi:type 1 glutamine amidotransferase